MYRSIIIYNYIIHQILIQYKFKILTITHYSYIFKERKETSIYSNSQPKSITKKKKNSNNSPSKSKNLNRRVGKFEKFEKWKDLKNGIICRLERSEKIVGQGGGRGRGVGSIVSPRRPLLREEAGSIWEPRRCSWHLAGIQLNIDPAPFSAGKQLCTLINAPPLSAQSNRIVLERAESNAPTIPNPRGSSIPRGYMAPSFPRFNARLLLDPN